MGEYVPRLLQGTSRQDLSAVGGTFCTLEKDQTVTIRANLEGEQITVSPTICTENADFAAWYRHRYQSELIVVHSDGSRFKSRFFDSLQRTQSRLRAARCRRPVLHVPAGPRPMLAMPDGSYWFGTVVSNDGNVTLGSIGIPLSANRTADGQNYNRQCQQAPSHAFNPIELSAPGWVRSRRFKPAAICRPSER